MTHNKKHYADLKAVFLNCTLKKGDTASHTETLMRKSIAIMEAQKVDVSFFRVINEGLATGVDADMTQHGWESDKWPALFKTIEAADIIVIGTPIWLGQVSSVCTQLIERLYAMSDKTNKSGQYIYYNKVGASIVTGNEDGVKHCAMFINYALSHIGCTIPPQADAGWIGEIGPGLSYGDTTKGGKKAGFDNDFTNRNTTFMTWNLLHMARMIKDAGGIPNYGNQPEQWKKGERFGFPQDTN